MTGLHRALVDRRERSTFNGRAELIYNCKTLYRTTPCFSDRTNDHFKLYTIIQMDLIQASNPIRSRKKRYLANHFKHYSSTGWTKTSFGESGNDNNDLKEALQNNGTWVVCRFSLHSETVLYLGDDEGNIGIVDVTPAVSSRTGSHAKTLQCFVAHDATVMDVLGVPNCPNQLLSISGDTTVRLWDLQRLQSTLYFGHEMSVRSVCFAPDSSNVFATGGRDGQIRLWDTRTSCFEKQGKSLKRSVNVYKNAHVQNDVRATSKKKCNSVRLSGRREKVEPPSVTCLVYANEHTLVSSSSNAKSGLRLWDTRKISGREEGHILSTLEVPISKDAGITSLCLDRFGSSLFAAVTDNCIYEYGILTSDTKPIRHFTGAAIESFYVQVQASPVNDFLLCGSKNQQAVIWDLQDLYIHDNDCMRTIERQCRALLPKFTLNGHDSEVCCVGWSRTGKYIVSMDDEHFRVWSADRLEQNITEMSGFKKEMASAYELNESENATLLVNRMTISHDRINQMSMFSSAVSSRKRKEPFTSPTKIVDTLAHSPGSKVFKLLSPILPLSNITNVDSGTPDPSNLPTSRSKSKSVRKGVFYYRFPTENLPNKVYERFVSKFKATRQLEVQNCVTNLDAKKIIDDYCVCGDSKQSKTSKLEKTKVPSITEFGDSVCSKMLCEQYRALQKSPRKLTVKLTPLKMQSVTQIEEAFQAFGNAQPYRYRRLYDAY
ncbi:WD domain, G-beta repeat protein [Dictyocaulus viviparus]|uniref:WD domain, G-beta repeat protein n=1 Tax=Dictyocaulus viviparus TaxID=29172 RepID=A0A0D8XM03_DICVI|nr:WD domain, G-beta repeat protein [Dictyocaulus viviparus]